MKATVEVPKQNTEWVHKTSGKVYTIKCVTNEKATKPDYIVTVVYEDEDNVIWSRPLAKWYDSFVQLQSSKRVSMYNSDENCLFCGKNHNNLPCTGHYYDKNKEILYPTEEQVLEAIRFVGGDTNNESSKRVTRLISETLKSGEKCHD